MFAISTFLKILKHKNLDNISKDALCYSVHNSLHFGIIPTTKEKQKIVSCINFEVL